MACSWCNLKVLFIVLLLSSLFFVVALLLAFVAFPAIIDLEINKATRLEDGSDQYDRFLKLPFPLDFKVHIFQVENPDEVLLGAKPNLTEIGPFVYKQYREKTVIDVNEDEDTVTYTQVEKFEFDAEASYPHKEDDVVTVLNPALMVILHLSEEFFVSGIVDQCIRSTFGRYDQFFITTTVRELLYDGINFCKNTGNDLCAYINDIVCTIALTKRNVDLVEADYSTRFSFLNYKIKEPDGRYTVNRGRDNINLLGHIMAWNDLKYTQYWGDHTKCSQIKGTDSTLYPPRVTTDSKFYIFSTDICRFVEIGYQGEGTYKDVDGYLFGTDPKTLLSITENPEDDCYCSKKTKDIYGKASCFLDGVIDMQTCFGVPVLFSFPHFLWANPEYLAGVDGLNPDENIHKTFLLVEPNTGTPLQGVKRIQLNAVIRPIFAVKALRNMSRTVLPLLWVEEGVSLTDEYIDLLHTMYFDVLNIVTGVKWALIAISAILVLVFGGLTLRKRYFKKSK